MSIPYLIPGLIYLALLFVCVLFLGLNWYHLRRFGFLDFTAAVNSIIVGTALVIIVFFTFVFLTPVNWLGSGEIFDETLQPSFEINL